MWRAVGLGVISALVGADVAMVSVTMPAWRSDRALWTQAVAVSPLHVRPHLNLGIALAREGDAGGALAELERADQLLGFAPMTIWEMAQAAYVLADARDTIRAGTPQATPAGGFVYEDASWLYAARQPIGARRLLTLSTLWLQAQTGVAVGGFRAVNLGLHVIVACLLALVLRDVIGLWAGAAAAWLWAVQPMHVETVMALAGRGELLVGLGIVLAVRGLTREQPWTLLAGIAMALASKETAIILCALLPLVRLYVAPDSFARRRLLIGAAVLTLVCWLGRDAGIFTYDHPPLTIWASHQATALVRLARQLVWPTGFSIDYDYPALSDQTRQLAWVLLGLSAGLAWIWRTRRPWVSVGLAWMLLAAVPRLLVKTPSSYLNAHQFYVPSMGAAFVAAGLLHGRRA